MNYEFAEIRARNLADYEKRVDDLNHEFNEETADDGRVVRWPKHVFEYWLDHINAAIDAKWFKHLTKEQAGDFDAQTARAVFRQIDDRYTEEFSKAFADPN